MNTTYYNYTINNNARHATASMLYDESASVQRKQSYDITIVYKYTMLYSIR